MIDLPDPRSLKGKSLTEVLVTRKSVRAFSGKPLSRDQISYLLWACQGTSDISSKRSGRRTVPSAGATYPLEIFTACGSGSIDGLDTGIYRYLSGAHALELRSSEDIRDRLADACFSQRFIAEAPVSFVIVADYARTTGHYGERGVRYVHIEAGHAGQNVYLACEALGLATVAVGAFNDEAVARTLDLSMRNDALYVMPVGYVR
jgi:SagB-type dehydrogenase family enzyme